MTETQPDLILHPIRMRIIQALAGAQLTPQQLAERLTDVPQATLYRHLNKLAQGGVVTVVAERPVRGTVEKVYQLNLQASSVGAEGFQNASREDHMRYFATFVTSLLGDFARYLKKDQIDLVADRVGYHSYSFNMSDEEFEQFVVELREVFLKYAENPLDPERKKLIVSLITLPDADAGTGQK